jgi:hypothetical protein
MRIEESDGVSASRKHLVFAYYVTGHGFGHATRVVEVSFTALIFSPYCNSSWFSIFFKKDHHYFRDSLMLMIIAWLRWSCIVFFCFIFYFFRKFGFELETVWFCWNRLLGTWFWLGMMCTWSLVHLILSSPLKFSRLVSSFARFIIIIVIVIWECGSRKLIIPINFFICVWIHRYYWTVEQYRQMHWPWIALRRWRRYKNTNYYPFSFFFSQL